MKRQPPTFDEMMQKAVAVPLLMPGTPVWIALEYQRMKRGAARPALVPVPERGIIHNVRMIHYLVDLENGNALDRHDLTGCYSRDCHNVYATEEECIQCAGSIDRLRAYQCGSDPNVRFDDFAAFATQFPPSMKPKPWRT